MWCILQKYSCLPIPLGGRFGRDLFPFQPHLFSELSYCVYRPSECNQIQLKVIVYGSKRDVCECFARQM